MTEPTLRIVDVTDVVRHLLATGEIGGIPRLLVTMIENRAAVDGLRFCVFDAAAGTFRVIGNPRSLDVSLLERHDFSGEADKLAAWIEQCNPRLEAIDDEFLQGRQAHFFFLSSQWDTLPGADGFRFVSEFLARHRVTVLHHDSYLLDRGPTTPAAQRFRGYWEAVVRSGGRIVFISEHTRRDFERHFGPCPQGVIAHYDFHFEYPSVTAGVNEGAVLLADPARPYITVFSIMDGRKSPLPVIRQLIDQGFRERFEIALIVRFMTDDKPERVQLIDLVLMHDLKVFYSPNDATYLWLIKHAHAVFYPSRREGFGMVPLDCKMFGRPCFIPGDADYGYLHDNARSYESQVGGELDLASAEDPHSIDNNLRNFGNSGFAEILFEIHR